VTGCATYNGYGVASYGTAYSGTPPGTSGLPNIAFWWDPTNKIGNGINDAGTSFGHVVYKASRTANQFVINIPSTGIQTTAAIAGADLPATVVQTNQANTYTAGGQNFGAGGPLTIPNGPGLTLSNQAQIGYDTTATNYLGNNGANRVIPVVNSATPVNGDCVTWTKTGSKIEFGDSGSSCGTSSVTVANITTANYCPDTSVTPNTITCSTSGTYTSSNSGDVVIVKVANTTSGATTLNVNSIGAVAVKDTSGGAITTNLVAGGVYNCRYTSTGPAWQCVAPAGAGGGVTSVGLSLPPEFTVTNSPVTTSGTLTGAYNAQPNSTLDFNSPFAEHFTGRRWCMVGFNLTGSANFAGWCQSGTNAVSSETATSPTSSAPWLVAWGAATSGQVNLSFNRGAQNSYYELISGRSVGIVIDAILGLNGTTAIRLGVSLVHITDNSSANLAADANQPFTTDAARTAVANVTVMYSSTQSNSPCGSTNYCLITSDGGGAGHATYTDTGVAPNALQMIHLYEDVGNSRYCVQIASVTSSIGSFSSATCSTTNIPAASTTLNAEMAYVGNGGTASTASMAGMEIKWNP